MRLTSQTSLRVRLRTQSYTKFSCISYVGIITQDVALVNRTDAFYLEKFKKISNEL